MHYSNESNPGVQKHMNRTHMQSISRVFLVPVTSQFLFGQNVFRSDIFLAKMSKVVHPGWSWMILHDPGWSCTENDIFISTPIGSRLTWWAVQSSFCKTKVIWISCCADSLWPKMGEAQRKSKLSWGADTGAGESGYNPDNPDYNQDIIRI